MRILFIVARSFNPKQMYREYPLGVGYLGTVLKQDGHEISIYDQNVEGTDENKLVQHIIQFMPEVVGFSVITPNYPIAKEQIKRIKKYYPDIKIIAGGIHANLFPEDLLQDGVDFVVLGEGEYIVPQLVEVICSPEKCKAIPGLVFYLKNDLIYTAPNTHGNDLDELPFVDRSLYNLKLYTHHSMLASRGCVYKCRFCCNYTGTILAKGVATMEYQRVIDEMIYLRDSFDAHEIFFADDIFLAKRPTILAFCEAAANSNLGISWIGQLRVDLITNQVAEAMVAAGCQRVYFGVEAGSETILKNAQKGLTKEKIRSGIASAKNAGLRVKTGWIYGLPGTLEEQYEAIPFMLETRPHEISIHQLIPFPGTPYYSEAEKHGIRIKDAKNFESFCYGGLEGNIQFDYLSHQQLIKLLEETAKMLEADGYVSSDKATSNDEYIYTTPLSSNSMNVFRTKV